MSRRTVRYAGACAFALATIFVSERRSLAEEPPTVAPLTPAPSTGRVMARDECVSLAMKNNPDARTSESELEGQKSERSGVSGAFAPKLHVDAAVQQWNSAFNLPFALPGVSPSPSSRFAIRSRGRRRSLSFSRSRRSWRSTISTRSKISGSTSQPSRPRSLGATSRFALPSRTSSSSRRLVSPRLRPHP